MSNNETLISKSIAFENETTNEQRVIHDLMTIVKKQHNTTFITPTNKQKYDYNTEYIPTDIIVTLSTPTPIMDKYLMLDQCKNRTSLSLKLALDQL